MTRWEYRVLLDISLPALNDLGEEGWEVVTAEFDDEGGIFSALAKRTRSGGGSSGGGGGDRKRSRRRRSPGGNGPSGPLD